MSKKSKTDLSHEKDGEKIEKSSKKKRKAQKESPVEPVEASVTNTEVTALKKRKKTEESETSRKKKANESNDSNLPPEKDKSKIDSSEETNEDSVTDSSQFISESPLNKESKEVTAHERKLNNMLPTRQERQRRENQRKMQVFVAEMREKGLSKKEIEKLKKKVNAKLKHIRPDVPFSSVVGFLDMQIHCRECNAEFTFTAKEQTFYQEKQFAPPVRCKDCSMAKKSRMAMFDNQHSQSWQVKDQRKLCGGGVRSNWGNI